MLRVELRLTAHDQLRSDARRPGVGDADIAAERVGPLPRVMPSAAYATNVPIVGVLFEKPLWKVS